jgi:hypothetical protein
MRRLIAVLTIFLVFAIALVPIAQATQEIIDSDYKKGTQLKVSAVLYKDTGEIDSSWDYYAIKVTLQDIKYQNDPWLSPLIAGVRIAVPTWAEEVPANHEPTAGWHWGQASITFTYQGIGFSMLLPSYYVTYSDSVSGSWRYFDWTVDGDGIWFVFEDYAEFAVGVRVPQGWKPYFYVQGWAHWYTFYIFVFYYHSTDNVYWVVVDPPSVDPGELPTLFDLSRPRRVRPVEKQ